MEARSVASAPVGPEWQYEPKWDGFRCIVVRRGRVVDLQSKAGRSLNRYFPEIVSAALEITTTRFVLDGELVVPHEAAFSFDKLLQRIHPATSRVRLLAQATPALFICFDLLGEGRESLLKRTLAERRKGLERFARHSFAASGAFRVSPATTELRDARAWLKQVGATLDGIIAKRRDLPYRGGTRDGMQKIKNYRSADCVVGGFRYGEGKGVVGSLLLGLYDDDGLLNHVGFTSSIGRAEKKALTARMKPLIAPPGFTGAAPGGPSRWSTARSTEWQPLKPRLVVEVCYDHFSGGRFRHGARLLRWRPDKSPRQCTQDQIAQKKGNLATLLR
jgi:ATP-dependent DNA ligase